MALQMTWQTYRRKSSMPMGLKNAGNSCYLNSVLQCLTFTPPFANFCLANKHSSSSGPSGNANRNTTTCPFCLVEKRIIRSLSVDSLSEPPLRIVNSLHLFAKHFRPGRQEDAHEFLRFVIEACNDVCVKMYKARNNLGAKQLKQEPNTIVKEIFGGVLQSQVRCLSCGAESNKMDDIMDISLEILHASSLKEALGRFFQVESLDGNNKYSCEKCKKLSAARKQLSIIQAPNVLVIQLKRFEDVFGGKIDRNIIFEEHLELANYMARTIQDSRPEYSLFGTIVHSGCLQDSGHYYAYVKDANARWYCCNDAHVSAATIQAVLSEKVYILFFLRSNLRPKRAKETISCNATHASNSDGNVEDVSFKQKSSSISNSSVGRHSSRDIPAGGFSKVHRKSQMKFVNLEFAGSQLGSNGAVENGNGTSKIDVTGMGEESESETSVRKPSERSYPDVSFSSEKEERLMYRQNPESNGWSTNGKQLLSSSSSVNRVSESCFETSEESCRNGSTNGNTLSAFPSGEIIRKRNSYSPLDTLQKTRNHTVSNGKNQLGGNGSTSHVGKDIQNSLPAGRENAMEERVSKRQRGEPENMNTSNGHTQQDNCVLKQNAVSKTESEPNGAENQSKLDKFKEIICQEAREHLESCGWCDNVRDAMRVSKRARIDQMPLSSTDIDIRKVLIHNIKDALIRQLPDSVKQGLLERLRSFFNGEP
ncbi:ubiquitin carboxyl-terminal hydrolase 25 isoform X1 [Cryptomeria japonica]|uniref:ubiquitin carboxyl-terminal hydrolase 25 isoform X1 n=1 Tax=Cryptomeria japonica TaxID=3369 RepID=UPI0027DA85A3|nr:ubiquitin carboxyl-terminal hydrolase 25 isoform X1 [Cryptomeria japonica]